MLKIDNLFVGIGLIIAGVIVTIYGLGVVKKSGASLSWPTVEGTVLSSETTKDFSSPKRFLKNLEKGKVKVKYKLSVSDPTPILYIR